MTSSTSTGFFGEWRLESSSGFIILGLEIKRMSSGLLIHLLSGRSADYNPSFVARIQTFRFSSCWMLKSISCLVLTGVAELTGSIFRWRRRRGPRWCSPCDTQPWPSRRTGTRGANRRRRRRRWWWASWSACSCFAGSPSSSPSSSCRCAPATSRPSGRASSCGWATPTPSSTR